MNARFLPSEIERVKASVRISDVIAPHVTWDKRKTNHRKGDWWANCPFHGEFSPSFHCEDSKGRFHCFGCGISGDAISFLTEYRGLTFNEAVRELGATPDPATERQWREKRDEDRRRQDADREMSDEQRRRIARATFKRGAPIAGTLAETYLLGRGIPERQWSDRLRFVAELELDMPPFGHHPALVALVSDVADQPTAIWRIYLTPDGSALTDESGAKVKRGLGPAAGGAVRLSPAGAVLAVTEGLETAHGVMALIQGRYPVWAALSTSGMIGLEIPDTVRTLHIYADGDKPRFHKEKGCVLIPPGRDAALRLRARAAERGISVTVNEPPVPGMDWLDVLNCIQGRG